MLQESNRIISWSATKLMSRKIITPWSANELPIREIIAAQMWTLTGISWCYKNFHVMMYCWFSVKYGYRVMFRTWALRANLCAHAHTHTRTHARTHAHTHTCMHMSNSSCLTLQSSKLFIPSCFHWTIPVTVTSIQQVIQSLLPHLS